MFGDISTRSIGGRTPRWQVGYRVLSRGTHLYTFAQCVFLTFIVFACTSDRRESFYLSVGDANRDGAITRGWIPEFLPQSSRNIHELHHISKPREWCAFEFQLQDLRNLEAKLTPARTLTASVQHVPNPDVPWWPNVLSGDLDASMIRARGFDLYEQVVPETASTKEVMLFAIQKSEGRAFFYRTRAFGGE